MDNKDTSKYDVKVNSIGSVAVYKDVLYTVLAVNKYDGFLLKRINSSNANLVNDLPFWAEMNQVILKMN